MKCVGPTLSEREIAKLNDSLEFTPALDDLAARLALAGNGTRLKLFWLLSETKELCVCDMAEIVGLSMSAISQHLAKLRAYGLVKARRDASTLYYSLTDDPFNDRLRRAFLKGLEL